MLITLKLEILDAHKYMTTVNPFKRPVFRVHKDRHDSKSGQIVYHICYNFTYYMGPDTANLADLRVLSLSLD